MAGRKEVCPVLPTKLEGWPSLLAPRSRRLRLFISLAEEEPELPEPE